MPEAKHLKLPKGGPKEITDAHNISLDGSPQSSASKRGDASGSINHQQSSEFGNMNNINVINFGVTRNGSKQNVYGSSDIDVGGTSVHDNTPEIGQNESPNADGKQGPNPVEPKVKIIKLDTPISGGDLVDETPLAHADEAIRE